MTARRLALTTLLALFLGACASLPPPPLTAAQPAVRTYHQSMEMSGRLSVQYQRDGRDGALHGSFSWSQTAQDTHIALLSPLGQILAQIDVTPQGATLIQSGQEPRAATDADALAAEVLGWPLPVAGLRDWLQAFATDPQGRRWSAPATDAPATILTRDGWQLNYASWQADDAQPALRPRRIDLARNTAQAGRVAIRIVIDNWQPG